MRNKVLEDFFIAGLVFIIIILLRENNYIDFSDSTGNGTKDGGIIIAVIDKLFGIKTVFLFLYYIVFLCFLMAYKDYLVHYRSKISYKKWQIIYIRFIKFLSILSVIVIFVCLPIYAIVINKYHSKQIDKSGKETLIYISDKVQQRSGYYVIGYFYANQQKYTKRMWYISSKSVNTFMKVKYLQQEPNQSKVDEYSNVPLDSVYKYFPMGKNPFESEIKKLKERKSSYILDMDSIK